MFVKSAAPRVVAIIWRWRLSCWPSLDAYKPAVELLFARQSNRHATREAGIRVIDTAWREKGPQGTPPEEVEFVKLWVTMANLVSTQAKSKLSTKYSDEKEIAHSVGYWTAMRNALRNNKERNLRRWCKMIDGPIVVLA